VPTPQTPAVHAPEALAGAHACPHPPQFAVPAAMSVSQPFAGSMSQSANPATHDATAQLPARHAGTAFAGAHDAPQPPQFTTLVRMFASQPFAAFPSQFSKPLAHTMVQPDATHAGDAFVRAGHAIPQRPQFATDEVTSVSQPFVSFASQLPVPEAQVPSTQDPATHVADACGKPQTCPQMPQFDSFVASATSHPLVASLSQSAKPALHREITHAPAEQPGTPPAAWQASPHIRQFATSVRVSTSQPFAEFPSQSARSTAQLVRMHTPPMHVPAAPVNEHAIAQVPQCATDRARSVSQPFDAMPSQSP